MNTDSSILLLGESDVGKTHFGAQLLKRLMRGDGCLRMHGAASNVEPYAAALESLNEGRAAEHTVAATYVDSVWPVVDEHGRTARLIWPDYGGEQVRTIISARRVPKAWRARVLASSAWMLLIRLQKTQVNDDMFSRPLSDLRADPAANGEVQISDQARLIELLQFLMFVGQHPSSDQRATVPQLAVLLSCWDELGYAGKPADALQERLPMFGTFVRANWEHPLVLGLSALGRPLAPRGRDLEYVAQGPEQFGYTVLEDGSQTPDLTVAIALMLEGLAD